MGKLSVAEKLTEKMLKKVPYKVAAKDGELALKSPVAKAAADFRSLDTIEMMDPEMVQHLEGFNNPIYVEHLEADKGYGSKALKQLEDSAKKRGADSAYLNASPVGGTRGLSQDEAARKVQEFYKKNGYQVAEEYKDGDKLTNTMMYKKLGLVGSQAPKIAAGMLKPNFNLGKAFSDITEPINKLDAPVNSLIEKGAEKFANLTDLKKGATGQADETYQPIAKGAFNTFMGAITPTPSSMLMGMPGTASKVVNKMIKPISAAEQYLAKKGITVIDSAADKAAQNFGTVTKQIQHGPEYFGATKLAPEAAAPLGNVSVVPDAVPKLGRVIMKP